MSGPTRSITLREAFYGLRNEGVGPITAGAVALLWWLCEVQVDFK